MTCSKDDTLCIYDNSFLTNWVEKFYISIIESNFTINLYKYKRIFDLFSILTEISKFNIFLDKDKLLNKLHTIELKWRGNELSIKKMEKELKKVLFKLKEEKIDYKVIILICEINHLFHRSNSQQINEFNFIKKEILEKFESDKMTKFEKKIAAYKLENIFNLLSKMN